MELLRFEVTPFVVNCYVLKSGDEALVIDPGEASPELMDALEGLQVRMIVNTHCHCDHCGGNSVLARVTGAPLAAHEADLPLLRAIEVQGQMFGLNITSSPMPDHYLKEGEVITVGTVQLKVLRAPGHSPGHVVLLGDGVVFVGDVLFAGSIGRTDLPGGDYHQLMQSIQSKLLTLADDTVVYPGHGPATTIGQERRTNPFLTQS